MIVDMYSLEFSLFFVTSLCNLFFLMVNEDEDVSNWTINDMMCFLKKL